MRAVVRSQTLPPAQVPLPPWTEAWTEAALPAPGKLLEAASLAEELLQRDAVDRAVWVLQASGKDR